VIRVVFVDRDGTLIDEPPDEQIDSLEKLRFKPGLVSGLRLLREHGYRLVMVTNQDGLGTPAFPLEHFERPQRMLLDLLQGEGITFDAVLVCPHRPEDRCDCRKPSPGLLVPFLAKNLVDLSESFVLGDRKTDVELARNLGCRAVRIGSPCEGAELATDSLVEACRAIALRPRRARAERISRETRVRVALSLDGSGHAEIHTGIGFFDHMLEQLAKHGAFDIEVSCEGDLHVDEHHTVEDVALTLGQAFERALGERRGIGRYGFWLPMDEADAHVAVDLGGRPFLVFEGGFHRERVGGLPTELVPHFFRSLGDALRANLHIRVRGSNDHHQVEAIFKAAARALRQAVARDAALEGEAASTKGFLA
jgi:imidazoleglycerol-phosphate dehydratase / histidinol-phosphatase